MFYRKFFDRLYFASGGEAFGDQGEGNAKRIAKSAQRELKPLHVAAQRLNATPRMWGPHKTFIEIQKNFCLGCD